MFAVVSVISSYHRRVETLRDLRRRKHTIAFCQNVLNGENKQICAVVEEHNFSRLNVAGLNLTEDTFAVSFKHVCDELFRNRPVRITYIIPIFGFALQLDEYHLVHSEAWYRTHLLICALADVLIEHEFEVSMRNRCTLL